MREYARISPRFWMGQTGRKIRDHGQDAQLLALYLLTSPHSNMIGLYWCPVAYMAHETGMTIKGASEGLARLCEADFCSYDTASEVVWVHEMARYQIGDQLSERDKQAKGVQNAYDDLPKNPFLPLFFSRYADSFCMKNARGFEGACMPLASKEQEKEQEQEQEQAKEQDTPRKRAAVLPRPDGVSEQTWADFIAQRKAHKAPLTQTALDQIAAEARKACIPLENALQICCARGWRGFRADWLNEARGNAPAPRPQALSFRERDKELAMTKYEEIFGKPHPDRAPAPTIIDVTPTQTLLDAT